MLVALLVTLLPEGAVVALPAGAAVVVAAVVVVVVAAVVVVVVPLVALPEAGAVVGGYVCTVVAEVVELPPVALAVTLMFTLTLWPTTQPARARTSSKSMIPKTNP